METHAYNESYLSHTMVNMGVMFDYGINGYGITAPMFLRRFITSGIAGQIEKGNPGYLVGRSGIELADMVVAQSGGGDFLHDEHTVTFGKSREYWAGWVLAFYQWKSCRSFAEMQRNGLDMDKILAMYHPLHEADPAKFYDIAEDIISSRRKMRNPLKDARLHAHLTQQSLSELSGVSLRMIRAYEQGSQQLAKAEFETVMRLAKVLRVPSLSLIF